MKITDFLSKIGPNRVDPKNGRETSRKQLVKSLLVLPLPGELNYTSSAAQSYHNVNKVQNSS
jgi:hypothetical protein